MDSGLLALPSSSSNAPGLLATPPTPVNSAAASWIGYRTPELSPTSCNVPVKPQPLPSQSSGVTNCYVFKSRLQEYAQKVGFTTPVYQTVKEGPSHEPVFKSTVIVNDVKYDSLPGFFNRKASEQSAAEVALIEIHKSGHMTECIPTAHETGLCKNMLQEYAQKMNYAIPSYVCGKQPSGYVCTVEISGIQYIGAAANTKKEAEIKAARTTLLAIQYGSETSSSGASQYTVLPGKKKAVEAQSSSSTSKRLKPKKSGFKKKQSKKMFPRKNDNGVVGWNKDEANTDYQDQQQPERLMCHEPAAPNGVKKEEAQREERDYVVSRNGYSQGVHQEGVSVKACHESLRHSP